LSGWVHFLCFKRKPKDQYDEEALIAWIFSCNFSCNVKRQIEWPMGPHIGKYDENTLIGFKTQLYKF
jgi:hypothetical protein